MSTFGNLLWIILGGLVESLVWCIAGFICYISVVGIPLGRQCFKFASLSLTPFGKKVVYGGGSVSFVANIIWLLLVGFIMAIINVIWGLVLCATIIGIPFGKQFLKLAKLWLMPFGAKIVN